MKKFIIYLVCGLMFSVTAGMAQVFNTSIPYHVIGDKMVVHFKINGTEIPFIFDTGGQTSMSSKLKTSLGLTTLSKREITDVNNSKVMLEMVKIPKLESTDGQAIFTDVNAMIIDNEVFGCFDGAVGLIGSDLFQKCSIEIDDKTKTINITNQSKLSLNGKKQVNEFLPNSKGMPIFLMNVGDFADIDVLFDSGAGSTVLLKTDDFRKLLGAAEVAILRKGTAIGSIGVNGFGPSGSRYLINIPAFKLGKQKFVNFKSGSANSPHSLLGVEMLNYGKVTIDYINKLFYFEPYQAEAVDNTDKKWDVDLFVKDNKLMIAAIWDDVKADVKLGDQVTQINGKPVKPLNLCESMIQSIPELKNNTELELTVQTSSGEKKITIKKT